MKSQSGWLYSTTKILLLVGLGVILSSTPVHAQSYLSGTYRCVSVEIAGKAHPCTAPSLEMNPDGSYQMLAERGTYEILSGHWLVLSAAKNHGRARVTGKEIIFEFLSGGKRSKITYRRKYQRPPAWVSG
jgi:hypothetical protein